MANLTPKSQILICLEVKTQVAIASKAAPPTKTTHLLHFE